MDVGEFFCFVFFLGLFIAYLFNKEAREAVIELVIGMGYFIFLLWLFVQVFIE